MDQSSEFFNSDFGPIDHFSDLGSIEGICNSDFDAIEQNLQILGRLSEFLILILAL